MPCGTLWTRWCGAIIPFLWDVSPPTSFSVWTHNVQFQPVSTHVCTNTHAHTHTHRCSFALSSLPLSVSLYNDQPNSLLSKFTVIVLRSSAAATLAPLLNSAECTCVHAFPIIGVISFQIGGRSSVPPCSVGVDGALSPQPESC